MQGAIGIFDSGYGGLTVLQAITQRLPDYNYIYLGDNARAPYGTRSFETVYRYTLQAVQWLFAQGCPLVILACNTASAKALRTIQQNDLPRLAPNRRVLGVIRPTAEVIGNFTRSGHIGIVATKGTVQSQSYLLEIQKFFPHLTVHQQACPMWVPLIENNQHLTPGAHYFVSADLQHLLAADPQIDTLLLGCTHYPLLQPVVRRYLPPQVQVVSQGALVAESLADYLRRHPEMEMRLAREGQRRFYTTDEPADFEAHAQQFYGQPVTAAHTVLEV
ncbi:MAG: glutamate racemase [Lacibacter sp.]